MSASFELTSLPGWAIVRSLLNDLRAQSALFEAFVGRQLETLGAIRLALDARRGELEQQQIALVAERFELDDKWKQLDALRESVERGAQRVQDDARRLAAAQTDLAAIAGAFEQQGIDTIGDGSRGPDRRLRSNDELAGLRNELRQAQTQISSLAGSAPELRAARREVDKLRRRLMRQNVRLAQAKAQSEARQSQQVQQMKDQRNRLACEFEASQTRATELAAQIELQREQVASERKSWLGEVRRLRQAVETQLRSVEKTSAASSVGFDGGPQEESLDSILRQFEALQKELSQRLQPVPDRPAN